MDIKLEHEEVHEILIGRASAHNRQHLVPAVNELLDVSILESNLVQTGCVGHGLVLLGHREALVDHLKHLPAGDVPLVLLSLFGFRLFDLLAK